MKKLLFVALLLLAGQWANAQSVKFGIKLGAGATTASLKQSLTIPVPGSTNTLTFSEGDASFNFHAGFAARVGISSFFLQPEVYFSSISNEMNYTELSGATPVTVAQTMTRLDIPVLAGVKIAKIFRLQAGPVASLALDKNSGVRNQIATVLINTDVTEDSGSFLFGLQVGGGVDIGSRLSVDVRYETNLSWFGSEMQVGNSAYDLDLRSRQVLLSLGLWF